MYNEKRGAFIRFFAITFFVVFQKFWFLYIL